MKFICKQNTSMAYSVQTKVAARSYHVHKNATWEEAEWRDKVLIELNTDKKQ